MTTTATDYAITKRGMGPPLRKRDKPLRTYGKRPQTTATTIEPPAKRRKSSESDEVAVVTAEKEDTESKLDTVLAKSATETGKSDSMPAPKGSILSYFTRVEAKTVATPTKEKEEEEVSETQPVLSPPQATRRKPRILRLRASTAISPDDPNTRPPSNPRQARSSREPLEESTGSARNSQTRPATTGSKRKATVPAVQTTLNISPQAAFSECKVCDTVWNPLFPDDVKYHQKRHKTMLALKRRREGAVEEL